MRNGAGKSSHGSQFLRPLQRGITSAAVRHVAEEKRNSLAYWSGIDLIPGVARLVKIFKRNRNTLFHHALIALPERRGLYTRVNIQQLLAHNALAFRNLVHSLLVHVGDGIGFVEDDDRVCPNADKVVDKETLLIMNVRDTADFKPSVFGQNAGSLSAEASIFRPETSTFGQNTSVFSDKAGFFNKYAGVFSAFGLGNTSGFGFSEKNAKEIDFFTERLVGIVRRRGRAHRCEGFAVVEMDRLRHRA